MATTLLADLSQREKVEAQNLAVAAATQAASSIHTLTITAASKVLGVLAKSAQDTVANRSAQLRQLRADFQLTTTAGLDVAKATRQAQDLLLQSLAKGYATDLVGRAAVVEAESTALRITVTTPKGDIDALKSYPVQGHTCQEIAEHLGRRLRFEIDGALGNCLGGTADPATITAALGNVALAHGGRVGDAARIAYYGGTQAAQKALGLALTGRP